jgi:hypothetical protein
MLYHPNIVDPIVEYASKMKNTSPELLGKIIYDLLYFDASSAKPSIKIPIHNLYISMDDLTKYQKTRLMTLHTINLSSNPDSQLVNSQYNILELSISNSSNKIGMHILDEIESDLQTRSYRYKQYMINGLIDFVTYDLNYSTNTYPIVKRIFAILDKNKNILIDTDDKINDIIEYMLNIHYHQLVLKILTDFPQFFTSIYLEDIPIKLLASVRSIQALRQMIDHFQDRGIKITVDHLQKSFDKVLTYQNKWYSLYILHISASEIYGVTLNLDSMDVEDQFIFQQILDNNGYI